MNDKVLASLKYRGRAKTYIMGLYLLGALSRNVVIGIIVLGTGLLIWLFYRRSKISDDCFLAPHDIAGVTQLLKSLAPIEIRSKGLRLAKVQHKRRYKGIRSRHPFLIISSDSDTLILTPKRFWSNLDGVLSSGPTSDLDLEIDDFETYTRTPTDGDEILGSTWRHSTKNGERDYRYKDNVELFDIRRYSLTIELKNDQCWVIGDWTKPVAASVVDMAARALDASVAAPTPDL